MTTTSNADRLFNSSARARGLRELRANDEAGVLRIEWAGTYVAHVDPHAAQWIVERFPLYGAGLVPPAYLRAIVIGTFAAYEQGLAELQVSRYGQEG